MSRLEDSKVVGFSNVMLKQMVANENKGDWRKLSTAQVLENIRKQAHEAEQAVLDLMAQNGRADKALVLRKCANGANYFMILADVVGALE